MKDVRDKCGYNIFGTSDSRIMMMEEGSAKPKVIYE